VNMSATPPAPISNPFEILGVRPGASEEEIRAAYVAAIREHPAEKEPELFEKLRRAFEILRDPVERAAFELEAVAPLRSLEDLLKGASGQRRFAGLEAWLAVLRGE